MIDLNRAIVAEPRKPQRPHSYAGVGTSSSPTNRSDLHSYLEIIGYAGTDSNLRDPETAAKNYDRLDPAEVEELRRRANIPHEYTGLTGGHSDRRSQGGAMGSKGYEGLNPDEVAEFRQRASRPAEYAGLRNDDVEDLYSLPIKKHLRKTDGKS